MRGTRSFVAKGATSAGERSRTAVVAARRLVPSAIASLALSGCDVLRLGVVDHAGPVAAEQWRVYLILGAVLMFVAAPVLILTPIMAWHYRLSNRHRAFKPDWSFSWPLEVLIWVPPTGIVIGLGFLLWTSTHDLDPYRPLSTAPPLEVQVIALDWKWLFLYPDERIAAVDRLVIPTGQPVHLTLTSASVMQSFLVPRLGGQIYAMAGMRSELHVAATRSGRFLGENTQYNGEGFPRQKFEVVAVPFVSFQRFVARARAVAKPLDDAATASLLRPSVMARPALFSSPPPHLFDRVVNEGGVSRR